MARPIPGGCSRWPPKLKHSETAFLYPETEPGHYNLRWFTPAKEVELCGHATLASAHVLWAAGHAAPGSTLSFSTFSGTLTARKDGGWIELDFPGGSRRSPAFTGKNRFDILAELPAASDVCDCEPDMAVLATLPARGIIVTAPADLPDFDFVSRFFAPSVGIPEDPVTGSAHCCPGPYWGEKLGKATMTGFQCSERGGTVRVTPAGCRVLLAGHAAEGFSGTLLA